MLLSKLYVKKRSFFLKVQWACNFMLYDKKEERDRG